MQKRPRMPLHLLFAFLTLALFFPTFVPSARAEQIVDYGVQKPKDPESSRLAGIGSYHPVRRGKVVEVEVLDDADVALAECEAAWPGDSATLTCTLADGRRYRIGSSMEGKSEFADLTTGDAAVSWFVYDDLPADAEGRRVAGRSGEPRPPMRGHWVVESSRAEAEVREEWEAVSPLLSQTLVELEITLGILAERIARIRHGVPQTDIFCQEHDPACTRYAHAPDAGATAAAGSFTASTLQYQRSEYPTVWIQRSKTKH